jgi:hypothetical protein
MAAVSGDMAVLANHVACIEPLKPGLLEIVESGGDQPKKWFGALARAFLGNLSVFIFFSRLICSFTVSGGFATVHPNNTLLINAVEAYPLDAFSPEVRCSFSESCLHSVQTLLIGGSLWPSRSAKSSRRQWQRGGKGRGERRGRCAYSDFTECCERSKLTLAIQVFSALQVSYECECQFSRRY